MLIASRMATLNATMNKKNFPTVIPSREPQRAAGGMVRCTGELCAAANVAPFTKAAYTACHRTAFLRGQRDAKPKAGWTSTVTHTTSGIDKLQLVERPPAFLKQMT